MTDEVRTQIDELLEDIKGLADDKLDLADYVCFQMATWGGSSLYESLGILEEAKLSLRECFYSIPCDCPDCSEAEGDVDGYRD